MAASESDPVIYVISDMHIGGDEQLDTVDFYDELLEFLAGLEQMDGPLELIINGDAFGLWEMTGATGVGKFDLLEESYPELFEQFRRTGAEHSITLIPGNHDHELAAYEAYVDRFAAYNIDLVQEESLTRDLGDRVIYFEHGHQRDPNNRFEDFGNPHERPLGYYYNTHIVNRAGQLSHRGRFDWLKDVQAVTPSERVPRWLISKYVYREMHPALRYSLVPFLFLFNISTIVVMLAALDLAGIWSTPAQVTAATLAELGTAGAAIWFVLTVNVAIAGLLLLIAIPLYLILRDIKQTIDRFGLFETDLTVDHEEPYRATAQEIFAENPEIAVFCYGHTHRPAIQKLGNRVLVNTGTWLKRLHRREVIAGVLPAVFYPSYELSAVRIERTDGGIVVDHEPIEKPSPSADELSYTERFLTLGREPKVRSPEPVVIQNE